MAENIQEVLAELNTSADVLLMLGVLMTPKEVTQLNNRWKGVRLVVSGLPHRTIKMEARISIATVSRCARAVHDASPKFQKLVKRLVTPDENTTFKPQPEE